MRVWKRLRMLSQRKAFEADLAEEIRLHRELSGEAAFGSVALHLLAAALARTARG